MAGESVRERTWVKGHDESRQVDVLISAINEGAQYSLKEIRLTGAQFFPLANCSGWCRSIPRT